MDKLLDIEKAVAETKEKGYNCCQTVVSILSSETNLDEETLVRLASGFGGGMRKGEVCGALTGALMILSLKYGSNKAEAEKIATKCMEKFKENKGAHRCKDLLGYDLSIEEENRIILEQNIKGKYCPGLKADGVRIALELLNN